MTLGAAALRPNMDRTPLGRRQLLRLLSAAIWVSMLIVFLTRFSFSPTPPYVRSVFTIPRGWVVDLAGVDFAANSLTPGLSVYAINPQSQWCSWCVSSVKMTIMSFASETDASAQFDSWVAQFDRFLAADPDAVVYRVSHRTALGNRYFSQQEILHTSHGSFLMSIHVIQACRSVLTYLTDGQFGFSRYIAEAEIALTKYACP